MSDTQQPGLGDPVDEPGGSPGAPRAIVLVILAVVVVAAVSLLALRGAGVFSASDPSAVATSAGSSPSATDSASPEPSATASTSGAPSATSSATASPTASGAATATRAPTQQAKPRPTKSPVPLKTPAEVKSGLTASITKMKAIEGEAQGPGEVAGPAVQFTLVLKNTSDEELPLRTTVVNLYYGTDKTPASELQTGSAPLPATVAAGGQATATYVFQVPTKQRDNVLITVDYSVDVSLVAFKGKAPR